MLNLLTFLFFVFLLMIPIWLIQDAWFGQMEQQERERLKRAISEALEEQENNKKA
jgi:hypothetical protein